ncbi:methyl-accepting chemotaxis protein [Clostridium gasigenes]|uniref:methyl-accepting chemotaxis protein n=1 Tax=Clostridium gasigenes TaxID=94869 RepID=UPI001C0B7A01|nr:methyl-accepting chemotaxis protein [Clostridium gasigenes]MBU3106242.1 hypothetical protein [Clostridium gasigenes]
MNKQMNKYVLRSLLIACCIFYAMYSQKDKTLEFLLCVGITLLFCALPIIKPKYDKYSSVIIPSAMLFFNTSFMIIDGFSILTFLTLFITLVVATLYDNPKMIILLGVVITIYLLVIYLFMHDIVFSKTYEFITLTHIATYVTMVVLFCCISYLQCIKAQKKIKELTKNSELIRENDTENIKRLNIIKKTAENVEVITGNMNINSNNMIEISQNIEESVTNISQNINIELKLVGNILGFFNKIKDKFGGLLKSFEIIKNNITNTKKICDENTVNMEEMNNKMIDINQTSKELHSLMKEVTLNNDKIKDVLSIISNLSRQTNMLSLNAAIEASRAGESGKGFAIVAEQVKKLSMETDAYAKKIDSYLHVINDSVERAKVASDNCVKETEDGLRIAKNSKKSFDRILDEVLNIEQLSNNINNDTNILNDEISTFSGDIIKVENTSKYSGKIIEDINTLTENQFNNINTTKNNLVKIINNFKELE